MDISSEVFTQLSSNHHCQTEVVGVHLQFLGVQHAQLCIFCLDVVQVLHSSLQTAKDGFPVSFNIRVCGDCIGIVEVSKFSKIPLSPGQGPRHHSRSWRRCSGWWRARSLSIQPFWQLQISLYRSLAHVFTENQMQLLKA
uniref:Uncharacterized protein n=1 Tax=Mastacembelus armatus TaxID=205130 RepID=A0A3Q3LPQ1_9TELE